MFPGVMTKRGFWLYVCRIRYRDREFLYVGRTGDNASKYASSPFARMGQHLGTNKKHNVIRSHLEKKGVQPEECSKFDMVAYGPLFLEVQDWDEHVKSRDIVAALEKALADALRCGAYDVLNQVNSKQPLDHDIWDQVRRGFAEHFERIGPGP